FREQNHAMNRHAIDFRRHLAIHLRTAKAHGHSPKEVLNGRVRLLQRLFDNHAREIETTASSVYGPLRDRRGSRQSDFPFPPTSLEKFTYRRCFICRVTAAGMAGPN